MTCRCGHSQHAHDRLKALAACALCGCQRYRRRRWWRRWAIGVLKDEGLIVTEPGRGTFVKL